MCSALHQTLSDAYFTTKVCTLIVYQGLKEKSAIPLYAKAY